VAYEIRYLKGERPLGIETWDGSLDEARGMAKAAVESGEYDSGEVHGEQGLIYRWPRTVRPVKGWS
jgi:hypothetical protein